MDDCVYTKLKPDRDQLVFANYCISNMLGILDLWGLQ